MMNLEEAPHHEMATTHATGNPQAGGGGESWEINYVPFSGEVLASRRKGMDDVKMSNPPNTAAGSGDEVDKWQSSYVPFSPPASFPWKAIEDENCSKGFTCYENGGEKGEVHSFEDACSQFLPTFVYCSPHRWLQEILELVFVLPRS